MIDDILPQLSITYARYISYISPPPYNGNIVKSGVDHNINSNPFFSWQEFHYRNAA